MLLSEKQSKKPADRSLASRPLDLIYFLFFCIHIPATLFLDLQSLYPEWLLPPVFKKIVPLYVGMSGDPLVGGVAGLFGEKYGNTLTWFWSFVYLEAFFQLPVFFIAAHSLFHNKRHALLYPLLILYGASTATTTLPCILHVIATPPPGSKPPLTVLNPSKFLDHLEPTLTDGQKWLLLSSYVPFFLIPLIMAVDMARRVSKFVARGVKQEKWE